MKELAVIVLAAGEGTRMRSSLPKVLHPLAGQPLIAHVISLVESLRGVKRRILVLGHRAEEVVAAIPAARWGWVLQEKRLGTGDALKCALPALDGFEGEVLVMNGDTPLLTRSTLTALLVAHRRSGAAVSVLTARVVDPGGYGRLIRDGEGRALAIVEQRDLRGRERSIDEINSGVYVFSSGFIRAAVPRLKKNPRQGEYYLTDLVAQARARGESVEARLLDDPGQAEGVNDQRQLAAAAAVMRRRILDEWMARGVRVTDPACTYVDRGVKLGRDTLLLPGVILEGRTVVGAGCTIGPWCRIRDSRLGAGVEVRDGSVVEGAVIRAGAVVGPMSRIRPGSTLGEGSRVGNFVEVKKSRLGPGVKASHLTYLGDAVVGRDTNIGAGTVTCNYDGQSKFRTLIGANCFIGSDTMLVAPVTVGKGAVIGAGSVITRNVPDEALAVARARQVTVEGWAARPRPARREK